MTNFRLKLASILLTSDLNKLRGKDKSNNMTMAVH
jgi:hypothetical protein